MDKVLFQDDTYKVTDGPKGMKIFRRMIINKMPQWESINVEQEMRALAMHLMEKLTLVANP